MSDLQSRPFRPDPAKCCERCAFGTGPHAYFCALWGESWLVALPLKTWAEREAEIIELQAINDACMLRSLAILEAHERAAFVVEGAD